MASELLFNWIDETVYIMHDNICHVFVIKSIKLKYQYHIINYDYSVHTYYNITYACYTARVRAYFMSIMHNTLLYLCRVYWPVRVDNVNAWLSEFVRTHSCFRILSHVGDMNLDLQRVTRFIRKHSLVNRCSLTKPPFVFNAVYNGANPCLLTGIGG